MKILRRHWKVAGLRVVLLANGLALTVQLLGLVVRDASGLAVTWVHSWRVQLSPKPGFW